jgi:hypothetical protein
LPLVELALPRWGELDFATRHHGVAVRREDRPQVRPRGAKHADVDSCPALGFLITKSGEARARPLEQRRVRRAHHRPPRGNARGRPNGLPYDAGLHRQRAYLLYAEPNAGGTHSGGRLEAKSIASGDG